jgi:hypothetical protein
MVKAKKSRIYGSHSIDPTCEQKHLTLKENKEFVGRSQQEKQRRNLPLRNQSTEIKHQKA